MSCKPVIETDLGLPVYEAAMLGLYPPPAEHLLCISSSLVHQVLLTALMDQLTSDLLDACCRASGPKTNSLHTDFLISFNF